jgi:Tol biopolymer transport system component
MKKTILILAGAVMYAGAGLSGQPAQEPVTVSYADVAWSPDGAYLSFTQFTNTGVKMSPTSLKLDIYVVKPDGSGLTRVTTDEKNNVSASWAKDGSRLFFAASQAGNVNDRQIYSIKLDGSGMTALTHSNGSSASPDVSPDGKQLVYSCENAPRKPQICVMNIDGSRMHALTHDDTVGFHDPKWSPDGRSIAYFVEKGDQKDQVWTMSADGSGAKLLTADIGHNYFPTWLPDGRRLMFVSNRDGARALYTMNPDGTDIRRLLDRAASGRFSPDGRKLALIAGGRTDSRIVVANADGTNQVTILPK